MKKDVTIENLQPVVEENLLTDGYLVPLVFICEEELTHAMMTDSEFDDAEQKDAYVEEVVKQVKRYNAYKVFFVSEIWLHEVDPKTKEIKNTREAYQILELTRDSAQVLSREFTREEDNIVLAENATTTSMVEPFRFKPIQNALLKMH